MEPIEIVAIVVCAVIVLGVLISAIIRRVKGKTGCDCADCCGRFVFEGTQSLYICGS